MQNCKMANTAEIVIGLLCITTGLVNHVQSRKYLDSIKLNLLKTCFKMFKSFDFSLTFAHITAEAEEEVSSIVICQFMTGSVTHSKFYIKCLSKFLGLEPTVSSFHTLLLHIVWLHRLESLYEVFPSSSFHEYDLLWLWALSPPYAEEVYSLNLYYSTIYFKWVDSI